MPKLPSIADFGPRETPRPLAGVVSIDAARPPSNIGDTLITGGAQFGAQVELETDRLHRLQAEDAMNKLQDAEQNLTVGDQGFMQVQGGNAINRDKPLVKDYVDRLTEQRKAISAALPEGARQYFEPRADVVTRRLAGKAQVHVMGQRDVFEKQVEDGAASRAASTAGESYGNDGAVAADLERYRFIATENDRAKGIPEDITAQKISKVQDAVWTSRLTAEATKDPLAAYARFQINQDEMSPLARAAMKAHLVGAALPVIAAQEVTSGAPVASKLAPLPGAPLPGSTVPSPAVERFGATIDTSAKQYGVDSGVMRRQLQAESGGNPAARNDADIRVTGSPSIGIAQFQPATAARYGIDPKDPVQSIKGQAAYMSDLLKMFDGDYQKALAGYNWGEGNVQKAISQWGDAWMDHAPASTQAYVRKIVAPEQRAPVVADLMASPEDAAPRPEWGKRQDGTAKGTGFLGVLKTPSGHVASEYTIGININGKQIDVPSLVPTLTRAEVEGVLRAADDPTNKTPLPPGVEGKAAAFARQRIAAGKSVFAEPGESPSQQPASGNRTPDYASMSAGQLLALKTGNPVIDAMPADDKLRTMGLIHAEALRQRQEKAALMGTREQDARASFYVNGTAANAPTPGELVDAYGPIEGMKRARSLDEARQTGQSIQQMSTLPTSEIRRVLDQKPAEGEGFAERQKAYELKAAAAQHIVSARQADPVGYALATKSYGIQPLTPELLSAQQLPAFADEMRRRAAAAPRIANDYGTQASILTKGEGQALAGVLKNSSSEVTKQYLAAIYNGVADVGAYKSVMGQIAPDAPVIAEAGIMQARNARSSGRPGAGPDYPSLPPRDVAGMILDGYKLMNPDRKQDGKEHEGGKGLVRMPSGDQEKLMRDDFDKYVGGAFQNSPPARDLAWQTARAIYAKKTQEDGDQSGNNNSDRWKSAMELAIGGTFDHNGQKVVPPYNYSEDSFRDAIRAKATAIAPTTKLSANEIMALPLRNTGDGEYEVLVGAGVLRDKNGQKVLIQLGDTPPPVAAVPRIPGAKLGAPEFGVTRSGAVTGLRR